MKKYILLSFLTCFISGACLAAKPHPGKPKSATEKRIKKQKKQQKKHICPQIDC